MAAPNGRSSPGEIFGFFLRLGLTAFGGPAAPGILLHTIG